MINNRWLIAVFLLAGFGAYAQVGFQQKIATTGRINLTLSNVGTVGRPTVRSNTQGPASMSFPQKGKEHLFESGIWIGAVVNGQSFVSSSAVDASSGYTTGGSGYEFTPVSAPTERSRKPSSSNFSSNAVSDQDILIDFTDKNTIVPGTSIPITGHTNPLQADVHLEAYAWGSSYADFFVICNYQITNNSPNRWDSVWLGQWADLVVRNVNVTRDAGTAFYNKGRNGVDPRYKGVYAFLADASADDALYISSYGAMQFLGINYRGMFFNPDKPDTFVSRGWPAPQVNYNFWNFNSTSVPWVSPTNDQERYLKMKSAAVDSATLYGSNGPVNGQPNNWIQLISAGPLVSLEPGEKIEYAVAYVCANNTQRTVQGGYVVATPESLKELEEHFKRTRSTYVGENVNEDGKYDPSLDLNGNGKLDQYILPEAPASPVTRMVAGDNKVEIYWDQSSLESVDPISRKKDFEGYRIYRTNPGDDLAQSLSDNQNLIAQWDSAGNNIGYNNGFDAIRLAEPKKFEGDTTSYWYKYELDNLQNGWQYLFVVTAFDEGDEELGIESLESSYTDNATSVYAGTTPVEIGKNKKSNIGVYPNPYKTTAAWDGNTSRTHKLYFYNLPARCDIHIYTSSGDLVATMQHDGSTYQGDDSKWFETYSSNRKSFSGGEHAWDILSDAKTTLTTGVYLFTVKDLKTGNVETGKFAIIK